MEYFNLPSKWPIRNQHMLTRKLSNKEINMVFGGGIGLCEKRFCECILPPEDSGPIWITKSITECHDICCSGNIQGARYILEQ